MQDYISTLESLKNKKIDALVTAPINKLNIKENKKDFIGHTEFLENNFDGKSLMIMTSEIMKVAFVTGHIPLSKVASNINSEIVLNKIIHLNSALEQDFALQRPKIAILGLNPHAGENGMLGPEEEKFINPAIESARSKNILAYGAFSADSFFTTDNLNKFDALLVDILTTLLCCSARTEILSNAEIKILRSNSNLLEKFSGINWL